MSSILWRFYRGRFALWKSLAPLALSNILESTGKHEFKEHSKLIPSEGPPSHRSFEYNNHFYWDGNFGFILCLDNVPIQCVSFDFALRSVHLRQLQGARDMQKAIHSVRAPDILIELIMVLATWTKIKEFRMISGRQSQWVNHKTVAFLLRRYDDRAIAHGLKWNKRGQYFVRNMLENPSTQTELPESIRRII